ncbi:MAG: GNAT family N-acetyltransferase [Bacteroides sp.]
MDSIHVRKLSPSEYPAAMFLTFEVFIEFGQPDYNEEGIDTFKSFITNTEYLTQLNIYGAIHNDNIVGVIATKNMDSHISLFFVHRDFHKKGIGRKLFDTIKENNKTKNITVDSSTFAVEVYHKLGFLSKGSIQLKNGLKSVPMEYDCHSHL